MTDGQKSFWGTIAKAAITFLSALIGALLGA